MADNLLDKVAGLQDRLLKRSEPPAAPDLEVVLPDQKPLELPDKAPKLEATYQDTYGMEPDHAAKVFELARKFQEPEAFVDKNLPQMEKMAKEPDGSFWARLEKDYPGTSKYLTNPKNMAVAKDDVGNLSKTEDGVQDLSTAATLWRSLNSGLAQVNAGAFRVPGSIINTALFPYNYALQLQGRNEFQASVPTDNPITSFYEKEAAAYTVPELGQDYIEMTAKGNLRGAGRALANQIVASAPYTIALLASYFSGYGGAGLAAAGAITGAQTEKKSKDAGATPAMSTINALGQGGLEAGLENVSFGFLHGWETALAKSVGSKVKTEIVKQVGKVLASSFLAEGGEEYATQTGQDLMDYLTGVNPDALKGIFRRSSLAGITGGFSGMLMSGPSAMLSGYSKLGQIAAESKLKTRSGEAHREAVMQLTKDSAVENIYIPAEDFVSYFQSKNISANKMAVDLGVTEAMKDSMATGAPMKIPFASWMDKIGGTEHYKGLADSISFSPNELSVKRSAEHEDLVNKLTEEQASAAIKENPDLQAGHDVVYEQIKEMLSGAERPPREAEAAAKIWAQRSVVEAKARGMTPEEWFRGLGPIQVEGAPTGDTFEQNYTPDLRLNQDELKTQANAFEYGKANEGRILKQYEEKFGAEISTDKFRDFFRDAGYTGFNAPAYHEAASALRKTYQKKVLQKARLEGKTSVVLMAGGSGAGKTSALRKVGFSDEKYGMVVDSNLSNFDSARKEIDGLLSQGFDVEIKYVYRDPADSWTNGVLHRIQSKSDVRTVRLDIHTALHKGAFETIQKLAGQYANEPAVDIQIVDNSRGQNKAKQISLAELQYIVYNDSGLEERLTNETERLHREGKITEQALHSALGRELKQERDGGSGEVRPGEGKESAGGAQAEQVKTPEHDALLARIKPTAPEAFIAARDKSIKRQFLTPYTAEDMKDWRLFLSDDGVGFALTPQGDMIGVFNNSGKPGAGQDAVTLAISEGAKTCDCISGYLDDYYNNFGFVLDHVEKWDDQFAPKGWDYDKFGRPEIAFLRFPETLSREPGATSERVGFARAEKLRRNSELEKRGGSGNLPVGDKHIDWETRGGLDQGEQGPAGDGTPVDSGSSRLAQSGINSGTGKGGKQDRGGQIQKPLLGLPKSSPGPSQLIRDAARVYAANAGIELREPSQYAQADPERGARIAAEFDKLQHAPSDPAVKAAYRALIDETLAQYQAVKSMGLKIERIEPGQNPYPGGPREVLQDLEKGHLWFYPTEAGFGSGADTTGNPLLEETAESIGGKPLLANDVFRIVHDIFGHFKEGFGFGPSGEENAWQSHVRMYSPLAARAMTTETRGQNSWVNFGPQGEANRANPQNTVYADQKAALMPEWVLSDGLAPDKSEVLFQAAPLDPEDPRAFIQFTPQKTIIRMLKADASSFLHESAHLWLKDIFAYARSGQADEKYLANFEGISKWLKISADQKSLTEDQQETFARSFEAYLLEGKAPSEDLRKPFNMFRKWLTKLYKNVANLNVEMSDDVRGIFNRLLATEEEIAFAEQEAGKPLEIDVSGLSPEVQARMLDLKEKAHEEAITVLLKRRMKEIGAEHKAEMAQAREKAEREARGEAADLPEQRAMESVTRSFTGADPREISQKYIAGKLKGRDRETFNVLAETNGFAGGDQMARAVVQAPDLDEEVSRRVEKTMQAMTFRSPDQIREDAIKAIHNDFALELMALESQTFLDMVEEAEGRAVQKATRKAQASLEARVAKEKAAQIIAAKPVKEAGAYLPFFTAERNAAVEAARAMMDKDFDKAAEFKRKQMLNHALSREAFRARQEIEKNLDYFKRYADRKADLKDMPYGFIRQIDGLLADHEIAAPRPEDASLYQIAQDMLKRGEEVGETANVTGMVFTDQGWKRESLGEMVKRVQDNYYQMTIPQSVLTGGRMDYKDMSLANFRDLREAVESINGVGKTFNRFTQAFDKMEMRVAAAMTRASIEKAIGKPYAESMTYGHKASPIQEKIDALLLQPGDRFLELVNLLNITKYLDGGAEDGPMQNFVYRRLTTAEDAKLRMSKKSVMDMNAIIDRHFTPEEFKDIVTRKMFGGNEAEKNFSFLPDSKPYLTREEMIAFALNYGNVGNIQRLQDGMKISENEAMEVINSLTKKEMDFVQETWDYIDTFWPQIVELEMKAAGVQVKKVERRALSTVHGEYAGGYYPLAYDYKKSSEAYRNQEARNALYKQEGAAMAHTSHGHTSARVNFLDRPVLLSLKVLFKHMENVVHDLAYRESVIETNRFLRHEDVRTGISNAIGNKGLRIIEDSIKAVASDQGEPLDFTQRAIKWVRHGATFSALALKIPNIAKDLTGNSALALSEIGPVKLTQAVTDFYSRPSEIVGFVNGASPRMAERATLRDRDINSLARKWYGKDSLYQHTAFITMSLSDMALSYPVWKQKYSDSVVEYGHEKAVRIADETITRTFGSGSVIDQASIQRGGEGKKIFTWFYSWSGTMFNRAWIAGKIAGLAYDQKNYGAASYVFGKAFFALWLAQGISEALWSQLFRNSGDDDDDEKKIRRGLGRVASQGFAYVPVAREVAGYAINRSLGNYSNLQLPALSAFESLVKPLADMASAAISPDKELDMNYFEEAARAASIVTGYPQQVNTWVFNFIDWLNDEGEANWRDILTRKVKK